MEPDLFLAYQEVLEEVRRLSFQLDTQSLNKAQESLHHLIKEMEVISHLMTCFESQSQKLDEKIKSGQELLAE
jgi:hypothetical protein